MNKILSAGAALAAVVVLCPGRYAPAMAAGGHTVTPQERAIIEAARGDDNQSASDAIAKTNDQWLLGRIGADDVVDSDIRCQAVEKLDDQGALEKIAVMKSRANVGLRSTDPIYLEEVNRAAIRRIRDQGFLTRLAIHDRDIADRMQAVALLNDPNLVRRLSRSGDNHISEIARLRLFLMDPTVARPLKSPNIEVQQQGDSQTYIGGADMPGEQITIQVDGGALGDGINDEWSSTFPQVTSDLSFQPATVNVDNLIRQALKHLSNSQIETVARSHADPRVRTVAKDLLRSLRRHAR